MFSLTAKLTRSKLVGAVIAGGLLLCAFIILAANPSSPPPKTASLPPAGRLVTNDDRLAYLTSLGWDASPDPVENKEVQIPETFDDVYADYNQLQLEQGFDLKKYSGKTVSQFSYRIRNYPTGEQNVYLSLLIYNGRVIGGDVHSAALSGFMHGLKKGT